MPTQILIIKKCQLKLKKKKKKKKKKVKLHITPFMFGQSSIQSTMF